MPLCSAREHRDERSTNELCRQYRGLIVFKHQETEAETATREEQALHLPDGPLLANHLPTTALCFHDYTAFTVTTTLQSSQCDGLGGCQCSSEAMGPHHLRALPGQSRHSQQPVPCPEWGHLAHCGHKRLPVLLLYCCFNERELNLRKYAIFLQL